ncbi:tRNA methyl transferase [Phycomyces blakesleeanus]|uniref:tRNA-5-taurinomethyluridine 2-sulfurtransferase n=2 Tax=Phycomyces blakesleeanus TaxID=4837 RepID=A0A162TYN2_PHYB8|nr:hypothetical protein PHYBLDRAFT_57134 [Phycomyces blakesleeanus NRRL 1555(-)]OAD70873.1 hypothetical protein PHYBLDRAFT_57134 [Phycomyces blakesleeanus NRRL 1555(-)]|eukprot:XP_018288913.1 hypothetical protein PHYBLDRAFT_57134 [Phycomyces blakesleeanus NRRL 1555(-)]
MAMSGGVDSSVAAALLHKQGYQVEGIYMRNWDTADERGVCTSTEDWKDVQQVCATIGIKCRQIDFVKQYWQDVFSQTLEDYEAGLTPNPDIQCNRSIKFGALLDQLPQDTLLATGHYCRQQADGRLLRGLDPTKDQSYYLSTVPSQALQRTIFPLGEFTSKSQVKLLAAQLGLHVAQKKESMGICFVGQKRRFADFLAQYIDQPPGPAVDLEGKPIGQHKGLFGYTIGQSSHIHHGPHRWFVAQKDMKTNTLICVPGSTHPALFHQGCIARNWVWINGPQPIERVDCQVRYRQAAAKASLTLEDDGRYKIMFDEPVRAMAQGQQVVVWDKDWCLGGGVIEDILPALS